MKPAPKRLGGAGFKALAKAPGSLRPRRPDQDRP
jgi:hypothetical protein